MPIINNPPSLPEWLIADDGSNRDFVVHCHWPRFIAEFSGSRGGIIMMIDPDSEVITLELKAGREPAVLMARLMREAGDFYVEQLHASMEDGD